MSLHIFSSIFWQLYFFLWNLCWCEVGIKLYYAGGMDSITGRRTGIPQAMWYGQKIKKKTRNRLSRSAIYAGTTAQKTQRHPPDTSPSHPEVYTSPWIKLIHQGADTRSKRNYDPVACEKETTDTERF